MSKHFSYPLCKNLFDVMYCTGNCVATTEIEKVNFKNLCLYENPKETLENLHLFAHAVKNGCEIVIEDSFCKDIAPFIVMDIILRGAGSTQPTITILSSSIHKTVKHLKLPYLANYCNDTDARDVWPFPIAYGRSHNRDLDNGDIFREVWAAVRGVIDTLQKWLQTQSFKMVSHFEYKMESLLLELIGNSDHALSGLEDKSGGDWAIAGYMARRDNDASGDGRDSYVCYLTLVTMGKTIHETLVQTTNPVAKKYLAEYNRHAATHDLLSEESLMTAAATHASISSREAGGNGLTDFLHGFTNAAAAVHLDKRSFVISGHGHVRFFGKYDSTVTSAENKIRQPFNPANTIVDPPNTEHVFTAEHNFPGTIIGVKFHLDQDDLIARYSTP